MRIKLNKIKLENFKGIKSFDEMKLGGNNATVRAENGIGKTTIYDGFLWALFNKDSDGKTDFNIRPLDKENNPVPKVVVAVEAELEIDGRIHTLRKEQHEHIDKNGKVSYPKEYIIDGEPGILERDYKSFIENNIPEDKFKMLTDLTNFCGKLHWTGRREILLDMAGNIPNPAGFDELLEKLNGKKIKVQEKILNEQKKALEKDRNEISPRIDELQLGLTEYAQNQGNTETELIAKRDIAKEKLDNVISRMQVLLDSEKARQQKTDRINHLTVEQLHRASVVKYQTGAIDDLLAERAELERTHADRTQELVDIQNLIRRAKATIESAQNQIESSQLTLNSIREEFKQADSPNCSKCGQPWPANKEKPELTDIEVRGNRTKKAIENCKQHIAEMQDELNRLIADEKAKVEELKAAETEKNKRIIEINEQIKNRPEADPSQDAEWQRLDKEIKKLQAELGEPLSKQLNEIEAEKGLVETQLNELNKCLNSFDENRKKQTRIKELEQLEKDLAQKIADIEKKLDEIQRFKIAESKMVQASVNDMFQHVTWKLFKYYQNGEIDECCEALYHGTPYSDLSAGEKIFCGIDLINTLSDYYGVEVPLFVDHAESMTFPIEAESQVIKLYAQEGVKKLQVEVEQTKEAGKAVA